MDLRAVSAGAKASGPSLRLKANVDIFRHVYRDEVWYVLHDRALDRFYRVSAAGGQMIAGLGNGRPVGEIVSALAADADGGADVVPMDEQTVGRFLGSLDGLGLLAGHVGSKVGQPERQRQMERKRSLMAFLKSPASFRIPLLDPEPLLRRLAPVTPWLFGWLGLFVWLAVVVTGAALAVMHSSELGENFTERVLSTQNLLIAGAVYPAIKVVHEMMHALALKHFGCEVRRMGLIVVALLPIPYVDASASMRLPSKWDRMLVAAAGVLAELFMFGLAILLWRATEPGLLHTVCYNVAILTGLSTLLFNGNPLQRYDGYYVLADAIEVPDLGSRAQRYIGGLARRLLLGSDAPVVVPTDAAERNWLFFYGIASSIYRTMLLLTIALYIVDTFPVMGALLAVWTVAAAVVPPGLAAFRAIGSGPLRARGRASLRLGIALSLFGAIFFLLPFPNAIVSEGYVNLPDDAYVRPRTSGEITRLEIAPGQTVEPGATITILSSPEVESRLAKARAAVREKEALYIQAMAASRARAGMAIERLEQSRKELADAEIEHAGLTVVSSGAGTLLVPNPEDLPGRWIGRGEIIAMLRPAHAQLVRTVVPQWQIDLVRRSAVGVAARAAFDPLDVRPARILRIVPAASDLIPNPVLSTDGGGEYAVASRDAQGLHAAEILFWIDVELADALPLDYFNGKVHLRFDLGTEPLGFQLLRQARLVFLRHFHA